MLDDRVGQQLAHNQVDLGRSGISFNLVTATRQRISHANAHFASNPEELVSDRIGHSSNQRCLNHDPGPRCFVPAHRLQQWLSNY